MPAHRPSPSQIRSIAFLGAVCACAAAGVIVKAEEEISAPRPATASSVIDETASEIAAAPESLASRRFHHDKRQPRPPRHRSERASSFSFDQDLASAVTSLITNDDTYRRFCVECASVNLLSGHPLELLRPPSAWL